MAEENDNSIKFLDLLTITTGVFCFTDGMSGIFQLARLHELALNVYLLFGNYLGDTKRKFLLQSPFKIKTPKRNDNHAFFSLVQIDGSLKFIRKLVASTGIEPVSGASETLILSIVRRGHFVNRLNR